MSKSKKTQILKVGKALFWKYGFKRVTIEEICAEAGVSKMTYYKYFSNKMELVKALIEIVMQESVDRYNAIMKRDIPFTEKIELQIQMKMEGTAEISSEFLDDLMVHAEPEIMEYMQSRSREVVGMVYSDYIEAQKRGDIRSDIKPGFIIYFINHFYEMLKDEQLINMYKTPNELAMELIRFFFYGIINSKK